jgi:hypothetical protein
MLIEFAEWWSADGDEQLVSCDRAILISDEDLTLGRVD